MPSLVFLAALACVFAGFSSVENARAADAPPRCQMLDVDHLQASIVDGSAEWLTPEQFQFARALYMLSPPVSQDVPYGDKAALVKHVGDPDLVGAVVFVDGVMTCERLGVVPGVKAIFDDIKAGKFRRLSDPS